MNIRELRKDRKAFLFKIPGFDNSFFIFEYDEKTDWLVDTGTGQISSLEKGSPFYDTTVILCDIVEK